VTWVQDRLPRAKSRQVAERPARLRVPSQRQQHPARSLRHGHRRGSVFRRRERVRSGHGLQLRPAVFLSCPGSRLRERPTDGHSLTSAVVPNERRRHPRSNLRP
jgi:hypothetical protein